MFERAAVDGDLIELDHVLSRPSPPLSLRQAVYKYLLCKRNFLFKRRLLLFINQHQLAAEFAEYWASQAAMPTIPILATELPVSGDPEKLALLWNRDAYHLQSLCNLAMICVPDFTSAFESLLKRKIVADGPIANAAEIELSECKRIEYDEAIRDNQRMNYRSFHWSYSNRDTSVAISFTTTLRTDDCLTVQFCPRGPGLLHVDIGTKVHFRVKYSLYVSYLSKCLHV